MTETKTSTLVLASDAEAIDEWELRRGAWLWQDDGVVRHPDEFPPLTVTLVVDPQPYPHASYAPSQAEDDHLVQKLRDTLEGKVVEIDSSRPYAMPHAKPTGVAWETTRLGTFRISRVVGVEQNPDRFLSDKGHPRWVFTAEVRP